MCPIKYRRNAECGCKKHSCGRCSAACDVCEEVRQETDNVDVLIQGGAAPRWSCSSSEMGAMQARLQPKLREIVPTVREQTSATRRHYLTLAEMTREDGDRLDLHTWQSNFLNLARLGGAVTSPAVRTAGRVAAVLQDEGSSRPAVRAMGAFAGAAAAHPTGGATQAVPGTLGSAVEEGGRGATVLASLEEAVKNAPKDSASTRSGSRLRTKDAGLSGGRSLAVEAVLDSSSSFFNVKEEEMKRAALRYVEIPDCPELSKVKAAMALFIEAGGVYTGASVTCRELTRAYLYSELMECAASVCLTVPAVLASMRQFSTDLRLGDDDMSRFFKDPVPESTGVQSRLSSRQIPTTRPQYNKQHNDHPFQQAKRPFPCLKRTSRRQAPLRKLRQAPYEHESSQETDPEK